MLGDSTRLAVARPLGLALAAVLLLLAVLRMLALAANGTELYVDEAQYWSWSQHLALGYFSKPPLIAWIIAGSTSVCGDGEFCVRLPSLTLHLATAAVLFLIGRRLYSEEAGFWSAVTYATLPAVSLSSGIISTDVPLLLAWAVALLGLVYMLRAPGIGGAALLALGIGLGLNAKYAMAYFVPCLALFFFLVPEQRALLRSPYLWAGIGLGLSLIVPNLLWNRAHDFATFAHTADNARWTGLMLHPQKAVEFLLAQFGVFGPILFGTLLALLWRARGRPRQLPEADRLLLAFSVPIIVVVTVQALISRAHANWAAPAYIAATVLVVGVILREARWPWLRASVALHVVLALVLALATWQAGRFSLPAVGDPFARTLGGRELAAAIGEAAAAGAAEGRPFAAVLTHDRDHCATLLYYARSLALPVYAWRSDGRPHSHCELSRPYTPAVKGPVLLVQRSADSEDVMRAFASVRPLGTREIEAGDFTTRPVALFALDGYKEASP